MKKEISDEFLRKIADQDEIYIRQKYNDFVLKNNNNFYKIKRENYN